MTDTPNPNPGGMPARQNERYSPQPYPPNSPGHAMAPPKSFVATWRFAWLLGFLAIDRFYLGKVGTGLLKLVTVGGFGLWWLIRPRDAEVAGQAGDRLAAVHAQGRQEAAVEVIEGIH